MLYHHLLNGYSFSRRNVIDEVYTNAVCFLYISTPLPVVIYMHCITCT